MSSKSDFESIKLASLKSLETLHNKHWTDFNSHDPGITILEQVCYALSDLLYRSEFSLPDLLAESGDLAHQPLFEADEIFGTHALTLEDLRKLVIDIKGVRNAWIEPADDQENQITLDRLNQKIELADRPDDEPLQLQGIYRVVYENWPESSGNRLTKEEVQRHVIQKILAHRPLGTDFIGPSLLASQSVEVYADIEIGRADDPDQIMLEILQQLETHISPPVRFYSYSEMEARGLRVDEIFNGPQLEHGFIDSDELAHSQRKRDLRTSDMIQVIMDVPHVKVVRNIDIGLSGASTRHHWVARLTQTQAPQLNGNALSTIRFFRGGLPIPVDKVAVQSRFEAWRAELAGGHQRENIFANRPVRPLGRQRDVGRYRSFQHQFPATYGIGELGLPASATPERQAQALQLKAYLHLFDQLLADQFAQLAHVGDLFSAQPLNEGRTYFSQSLIDDEALSLINIPASDEQPGVEGLMPLKEALTQNYLYVDESRQIDNDRRNRFLNHLLARFGQLGSDFPRSGSAGGDSKARLRSKGDFLHQYPQISGRRGTGFNYLEPNTPDNRSGLELALKSKLGLAESEDFLLIEHILLRPLLTDDSGDIVLKEGIPKAPLLQGAAESSKIIDMEDEGMTRTRVTPLRSDPYSLQLSFVFPNDGRFKVGEEQASNSDFRRLAEKIVREETPAHLAIKEIQWLDRPVFDTVSAAHATWVAKLRTYWGTALEESNR